MIVTITFVSIASLLEDIISSIQSPHATHCMEVPRGLDSRHCLKPLVLVQVPPPPPSTPPPPPPTAPTGITHPHQQLHLAQYTMSTRIPPLLVFQMAGSSLAHTKPHAYSQHLGQHLPTYTPPPPTLNTPPSHYRDKSHPQQQTITMQVL